MTRITVRWRQLPQSYGYGTELARTSKADSFSDLITQGGGSVITTGRSYETGNSAVVGY